MKPKKYKVMIDIYKGILNNQLIEFTTQDHENNVLEFEIVEDKVTPYNLEGCIVRMIISGQQQDCTIVDAANGQVKIVLLQSMFSQVGLITAELQIYDATNQTLRLTTPHFRYNVKKSLMDDETVQADPNFSILQNMIIEVTGANKIANEAKKTAESAMTIANQAESKANQIMANGDYAKEQGDYAKAEGDRLQGILTLDGSAQTKFDFIKNQFVKDGLIEYVNKKITGAHVVNKLDISNDFTLVGCIRNYNKTTLWYVPNVGQMRLVVDAQSNKLTINGFEDRRILETDATPIIEFAMIKQGSRFTISINGIIAVTDLKYADEDIINKWNTNKLSFGYNNATLEVEYTCNNRTLVQQEIQHIFSVINNSPSIKELHTTDSTGKTSILKLASDTDHVEDRSGRTQEQINRTFYKRMCKEIPSPSGEPITVKNGEEGYVLSTEIKGNTQLFKRAKGSQDEWIVIPNDEGRDTVAFEYKLDSTQAIISNNGQSYPIYESTIQGKTRILKAPKGTQNWVEISPDEERNTAQFDYKLESLKPVGTPEEIKGLPDLGGVPTAIDVYDRGKRKLIINTKEIALDSVAKWGVFNSYTNVIAFELATPDVAGWNAYLAQQKANGMPVTVRYQLDTPIEMQLTEEQAKYYEAHKKVISLGGLGDTKDTLEILEDGSGIWLNRLARVVLNGSENWSIGNTGTQNYYYQCTLPFGTQSGGVSDKYSFAAIGQSDINQGFYITGNSLVRVRYGTEKPLNDFKQDLSTNNLTIICILATPIITHIPKEIVSAILTHNQTNILEAGGAVKPSSFKVTLPVDRIAEIEARLQALESTTVDVVLNK